MENSPLNRIDADGHANEIASSTPNNCATATGNGPCTEVSGGQAISDKNSNVHDALPAQDQKAQQQSSSGPGFFGRLGQRLNNFFHNDGFVTNAELDQVHGAFTSAYIVPGSVHEIEPNSYVTLGLDAAGIGATLTGHAYAAGGIAAGSSIYSPDPMNLGLNGMSLVPGALGEAAMPLTVVNDAGGLAGGVITNNIMAQMLMGIPGNTHRDGT